MSPKYKQGEAHLYFWVSSLSPSPSNVLCTLWPMSPVPHFWQWLVLISNSTLLRRAASLGQHSNYAKEDFVNTPIEVSRITAQQLNHLRLLFQKLGYGKYFKAG